MRTILRLRTKIFADGADLDGIIRLSKDPRISGFTTNPTLMRKAGVDDYVGFAKALLEHVKHHPISFEVLDDSMQGMQQQAHEISSWAENVYVKIPVTNTRGESMAELIRDLSLSDIKVNVTALTTTGQVEIVSEALQGGAPSYISVFAGRIADSGVDPVPIMKEALQIMEASPQTELVWASPREILNVVQASTIGCHIITVTHDLLPKLDVLGKSLEEFSLETVQMFHRDAEASAYEIPVKKEVY